MNQKSNSAFGIRRSAFSSSSIVLLLSAVRYPLISAFCLLFLAGCNDLFFNPTQIGRFRPVPAVNVILDSLGVAEEAPSAWDGAEDPKPADCIVTETDYRFGPGDTVRIYVFELFQEGVPFTNDYTVTETGKISIPEIGVVEAAGLTETQLEEEIRQILSPSVLRDPLVSVTLLGSQHRVFSILGDAVPAPGRYGIPRYDYRLTDALATAGGISQFNVSYIYVSRTVTGEEAISEPVEQGVTEPGSPEQLKKPDEPEELLTPEQEMMEVIAPLAKLQRPDNRLVIVSAEMVTDKELAETALPAEDVEAAPDDKQKPAQLETISEPISEDTAGRIEWIFQDGKWVPVQIGQPLPTEPKPQVELGKVGKPLKEKVPAEFDWEQIEAGGVQKRVIKIPADSLLAGDPRYNIVIRSGDNITVPVDIIGEFCIIGNVNNQGYVNLTGRPMTLKMAIAAAGGLGPLAWPKRCEVIRRIGEKREEIVKVDLEKIARGETPDFFIKPNDLINVGTHPTSGWRAVLRNAFRATYGFGFIYDRNFADRDYGTSRPFGSIYNRIF